MSWVRKLFGKFFGARAVQPVKNDTQPAAPNAPSMSISEKDAKEAGTEMKQFSNEDLLTLVSGFLRLSAENKKKTSAHLMMSSRFFDNTLKERLIATIRSVSATQGIEIKEYLGLLISVCSPDECAAIVMSAKRRS